MCRFEVSDANCVRGKFCVRFCVRAKTLNLYVKSAVLTQLTQNSMPLVGRARGGAHKGGTPFLFFSFPKDREVCVSCCRKCKKHSRNNVIVLTQSQKRLRQFAAGSLFCVSGKPLSLSLSPRWRLRSG